MAMSPGNQAITGGTVLRVPAIQSPNYVAGVSGWIVRQDGSAEFNTGTFRGSIEVGSLTGQHFWVNNPNTNDVIDVYNSANKLVFSIDSTGRLVAVSSVSTAEIVINGANLLFEDSAQSPAFNNLINGSVAPDLMELNIFCGRPQNYAGTANGSSIVLFTGDTNASEWINTEQRGILGAMLQTDQSSNAGQLVHVGTYTFNTDASGNATVNHGAAFTPTQGFLIGRLSGVTPFYQYAWFNPAFTSTTFHANFMTSAGAAYANQTGAVAFGIFIG